MEKNVSQMQVLDEQGRLFGRVNVIDVLVVVVVLAALLAGVALVMGGEGSGTEPEYATVTFEAQSELTGAELSVDGTIRRLGDESEFDITDLQWTLGPKGRTQYVAKVALPKGESSFYIGSRHRFVANNTLVNGTIREFTNTSTLTVGNESLHIVSRGSNGLPSGFEAGTRLHSGDRTVGRIVSVASYPTPNGTRIHSVGLRVRTVIIDGHPTFSGSVVREGVRIPVWTRRGHVNGTIERVGETAPPGSPTNVTLTLVREGIQPVKAAAVSKGLVESHQGATARVTDYTAAPASVVVPTDEGDLVTVDHPRQKDVRLTLSATAFRRNGDLSFHGRPLSLGGVVRLEFENVTIDATVTEITTGQ